MHSRPAVSTLPSPTAVEDPPRTWHAFRTLKKDARLAWKSTWRFLRRHKWAYLGAAVVVLAIMWFALLPRDHALLLEMGAGSDEKLMAIAEQVGWWGDFAQYNLTLAAGIWLVGLVRKSRYLQRLAMVTLLAATLAGLFCNVFRFTLGRPRPSAEVEDRLVGPTFEYKYQGFPSGHTSTAFGSAVPILAACPALGVPVTAFASTIGWARLYEKHHYPSDILIGGFIGAAFGLAGGLPLRKARVRARRRFGQPC